MATAKLGIRHNAALQRFEATVDGELARADYRMDGNVMRMVHTEVPRRLEGRGIAGALVHAALEHARAAGLSVLPRCSFVRAYMRRHPETRSLLAAESPTLRIGGAH
jgi:predicted GNAT family acetyltransferase